MIPRLAMVLAFCNVVAGQTTWHVGGQVWALRTLMPNVGPGDTIVVAPGYYFPFVCGRAVTIRAQIPGTVTIGLDPLLLPSPCASPCLTQMNGPTRLSPPAGETTDVIGIDFEGLEVMTPYSFPFGHHVSVTSGRVTFDSCTIGGLDVANAAVHVQDCTIASHGFRPGILASNADVTLVGGSVAATSQGFVHTSSTIPGVALIGSRLHANHTSISAGITVGSTGLAVDMNSAAWLADATITSHQDCAVYSSGTLRVARTTVNGVGTACATAPVDPALASIRRSSHIAPGANFVVHTISEPGALVMVCGSLRLGPGLVAPIAEQPIWIDPGMLVLSELAITATGTHSFVYPVPPFPQLSGAQFWLQAFAGTSFPLQSTPVVGGIVR